MYSTINDHPSFPCICPELSVHLPLNLNLGSKLRSYLPQQLSDTPSSSVSVLIPVLYSSFSAFAAITGDSSCERNDTFLPIMNGRSAPGSMIPPRHWYVIRFNTGCDRCHKRMASSKGPAQSHVRPECVESVIGSEFACDLGKDLLWIFSQFADTNRSRMSCFVVNEIFIFQIFVWDGTPGTDFRFKPSDPGTCENRLISLIQ
jgi:hypothetical protein